jgi:hypothetical protein
LFCVPGTRAVASESGGGFVTTQEIMNHLVAASIAYLSWFRDLRSRKEPIIEKIDN